MPEAPSRLAERGGALIEGAADASRTSMRTRFDRLRVAWRSIVQAAVAATAAYLIATEVVGHSKPFFAPVSAIITLGITVGQRGRRAVELALGVAVGIGVADGLVLLLGPGAAPLAVVVLLAMGAAVFLGSGQILATQAAVSAVLVATLQPASHGFSGARFIDALIGGGVALLTNALLLPADPVKMVRRAAEPVLDELAATLREVADAIDAREQEAAEHVLLRARELDRLEAELEEAVAVSRETARYAPVPPPLARHGRLLRRGLGADRPRDPQRPRARARRRARRAAGGEPAARDRRRGARPRRGRARPCARRSPTRTAPTRCARRRSTPPRRPPRCSSRPATCRSRSSSARCARPPSTCCGARG